MPPAPLIFSRQALRELDRRAAQDFHLPILSLMENAGRAVAQAALRRLKPNASVLILAGPGNNGADGLVAARHLHNAAVPVRILLLAPPETHRDAPAAQLAIVQAMRLPLQTLSPDRRQLRAWLNQSRPRDLIIDALFGTGLSRPLEGLPRDTIAALNLSRRTILSIDIPSGLDCDSGLPVGEGGGIALRAAETISFSGTKLGFSRPAAHNYTGKITIADIGAPRQLLLELAEKS